MKQLTSFPRFKAAGTRVPRMMSLYRDLLDIPDEMEIQAQPHDLFGTIIQRLAFDMHVAIQTLGDLSAYHPNDLEAHIFTRVVLEDMYQNIDVDEEDYPTSPGLEDTEGMNAIFEEFNLPGEHEGAEF